MSRSIRSLVPWLALAALLLASVPAFGVKYMSLGQAVKQFLPKDAKVFKVKKQVTPELRERLQSDYGWVPTLDHYTFYVGRNAGGEVQAYVLVVPEIFNTCFHKYAVGMKPDGQVIETAIVELSCPRAFPINRKSFLKQFRNKKHDDPLTCNLDIDAVTGATLSSEATAQATRKAVSLHNLLFGGGRPVTVSEKARAARAKGDGLIKKAIETGETLSKDGKPGAGQLPEEKK